LANGSRWPGAAAFSDIWRGLGRFLTGSADRAPARAGRSLIMTRTTRSSGISTRSIVKLGLADLLVRARASAATPAMRRVRLPGVRIDGSVSPS
jgi:hypothetical protein